MTYFVVEIKKKVNVPLDEIAKQEKLLGGFRLVRSIAEHYNIYKDLFKHAYFVPTLDLQVKYPSGSVHYGNKLPTQSVNKSN